MEKQRKLIVIGFITGVLGVILSAEIASAGPLFDPHLAQGGLLQCKADLANCVTNVTQTQVNYGVCLNDLEDCTANLSTCEEDLAACLQTTGVQRTGQTETYEAGDDGALQKGVMWSSPRFTDNNNGTVADNFTGLIWTKNANRFETQNWYGALASCNGLTSGADGLSDGSSTGDWRLPNLKELQSLIDYSEFNPALPRDPSLPMGHPFADVLSLYYWSSTTYVGYAGSTAYAWIVSLNNGSMTKESKSIYKSFVWCVRGGQ